MNPMAQQALGAVLRWLLALGAGWLIQHGVWGKAEADTYVAAAAIALVPIIWSLVQKYRGRVKLLTALMLPAGKTEQHVEHVIANGVWVAPTVTTPKDVVPVPKVTAG